MSLLLIPIQHYLLGAAVKGYVDEQFANGNTFDFQVEGGAEQALDLTGDQIDFIGGSNPNCFTLTRFLVLLAMRPILSPST